MKTPSYKAANQAKKQGRHTMIAVPCSMHGFHKIVTAPLHHFINTRCPLGAYVAWKRKKVKRKK
jgi:hypothetical protein